jgi:hypothetical protein
MRDVAMARTAQDVAEVYGRHTSGRLVTSAIGLAAGAIGTLASPLLRERPVFGILATLAGMTTAHNLGRFFAGTLRFRTSVLVEVFSFTLNLALVLLLVRGKQDGWLVLASYLASSLAATAVAHGVALRSVDRSSLRWSGASRSFASRPPSSQRAAWPCSRPARRRFSACSWVQMRSAGMAPPNGS